MKIEEAMNIKNTDIAQHLKLPPVKLHCSMLAEDAIKAAVTDYQKKKDITHSVSQWNLTVGPVDVSIIPAEITYELGCSFFNFLNTSINSHLSYKYYLKIT